MSSVKEDMGLNPWEALLMETFGDAAQTKSRVSQKAYFIYHYNSYNLSNDLPYCPYKLHMINIFLERVTFFFLFVLDPFNQV